MSKICGLKMTESIINCVEYFSSYAHIWGLVFIFLFMTMESTILPLPSEIVMIPAGFMAYRCELLCRSFWPDFFLAVIAGILGSICGAWINYSVSLKLGRPILYKYGKYVFIKEHALKRAEEIFNKYGDMATFVCRLVPVLRHLISIPAGLSKMNPKNFTLYTGLGAGLWMLILTGIGSYLGVIAGADTSYREIITMGEKLLHQHFWLIMISVILLALIYSFIHKKIMGENTKKEEKGNE